MYDLLAWYQNQFQNHSILDPKLLHNPMLIASAMIFFRDSLNLEGKVALILEVKIVSKPFQTGFGRTRSLRELRKASGGLSRRPESSFQQPPQAV